ncbi:MAG: oligopeptide transporter, OPT family [Acidobacteria bacterium]|jgi:putative OPT family oligopeptide transporter|nr:oligopeptide transporter, OPT family [Acidobacteriota bacterium]
MEQKKFTPFVSPDTNMKELTPRAVLLGVIMAIFMGAANAYLGLKAGMTIAATYTTAVIGMAVIKALKGTILEENCARTIGSIGGNIAAGAVFTLPAFFISGIWQPFYTTGHYVVSTIILVAGGILGIMFVTITRRILVDNVELPFPESIAAAEIHKAGQKGTGGTAYLFSGLGLGAFFTLLTEFKVIAAKWQNVFSLGKGAILFRGPQMSAAFLGVGYIIGPKLAGVNFSGGVLAWGLLAPAIAFFLHLNDPAPVANWADEIVFVWKNYVRYIAIGGMLVGAFYTLYKMRKNLIEGICRSISTLTKNKGGESFIRTDKDIHIKWVLPVITAIVFLIFFIFNWFSKDVPSALVAAIIMVILGFVFAAVSGYLVGIIGVSSNPTSGLTVAVLITVAFLMVLMGLQGNTGIAAVIAVAAFTCVSVSVAGEMMQDLKAGQILGCTPWRMQLGDIFGVTAAAIIMFFVLSILHIGDIKQAVSEKFTALEKENIMEIEYKGSNPNIVPRVYTLAELKKFTPEQQNEILQANGGLGGEKISAPQASLMAVVSKSIIQKKTEWILILVGIFMGLGFILMQIKSPMLVSVGMYLPIETTFAIFVGGMFKGIIENFSEKKKLSDEDKDKVNNTGTLLASGLIAGEALTGILFAVFNFAEIPFPKIFNNPSYVPGLLGIIIIGSVLAIFSFRRLYKKV